MSRSAHGTSVGVLYIIGSFQFGGWERQLLEIVRRLDRRRFYPVVAVLHRHGVLEKPFADSGVPIHTVGIRKLLFPDSWWRLRSLARFADAHGAQVVHGFNLHANFYGAFICPPRSGRALVASEGGVYVDLPAWQQWARGFVHRRSTRMIVNSLAVKRYVEEIPDPRPDWLNVIWNGVDTALFDRDRCPPAGRKELGLPEDGVLIGHIGRFREEKGQVFLLHFLGRVLGLVQVLAVEPVQIIEDRLGRGEAEVDTRAEQHGKVVHRGQKERLSGRGEDGPVLAAKGNDNGFFGVRDGKLEGEVAVDLADRGQKGKAELGAQGREYLGLGREVQPHQERADAAAPLFLEIKGLLDPLRGKS